MADVATKNLLKSSTLQSRKKASSSSAVRTRTATKNSIVGVSNISVSISSTQKSSKSKVANNVTEGDIQTQEFGVQVDDSMVQAANDLLNQSAEDLKANDVIIRGPSIKAIREVERVRKLKKDEAMRVRLSETRKFEKHAKKEEIHLTNLKEFLETGAISRKRDPDDDSAGWKPPKQKTENALQAYDRIKQREEELIKLFNSI